jgi:hypothetical protein
MDIAPILDALRRVDWHGWVPPLTLAVATLTMLGVGAQAWVMLRQHRRATRIPLPEVEIHWQQGAPPWFVLKVVNRADVTIRMLSVRLLSPRGRSLHLREGAPTASRLIAATGQPMAIDATIPPTGSTRSSRTTGAQHANDHWRGSFVLWSDASVARSAIKSRRASAASMQIEVTCETITARSRSIRIVANSSIPDWASSANA